MKSGDNDHNDNLCTSIKINQQPKVQHRTCMKQNKNKILKKQPHKNNSRIIKVQEEGAIGEFNHYRTVIDGEFNHHHRIITERINTI